MYPNLKSKVERKSGELLLHPSKIVSALLRRLPLRPRHALVVGKQPRMIIDFSQAAVFSKAFWRA
jgi:hypothetical protein